MSKKKAVFLDRDGTINEDVGYPSHSSQIKIFPSSYKAVQKINKAGLLAIVVTNQSGIGRGFLTEEDLRMIHTNMALSFRNHDARIDAFYYCPHYDLASSPLYRKNCSCRKPHAGMALQAAEEWGIDISRSYMIGDKVEDILFGFNIQATPILVLTGYGRESLPVLQEQGKEPASVAPRLLEAVNWICQREKG